MSKTAATEPPARVRGRLADDIGRQLADEIILGHFAPGARLDEVMLAERFKVSRTPVREALKQLAVTGLIDYRPNRGAVVAQLGDAQLDAMFEAIGEMEAACARHAALRMSDPERAELRRLHAQGREAMQARDLDRYDALNRELHLLILQGAHNPVLADLAITLRQRVAPFRRTQFRQLERMGESFAEHQILVEAILAHDAVAAHREMRNHLLSARGATGRQTAWAAQPAAPQTSATLPLSTAPLTEAPQP